MSDKKKPQLKITWDVFRQAALDNLSKQFPAIALNRDDNTRMVTIHSYEGEIDCYEHIDYVYIDLEPDR